MKNHHTIAKITQTLLPAFALLISGFSLYPAPSASALDRDQGPERATFTWKDPASYVTFNSITDNPKIGDERNFVRVREVGAANYSDNVDLTIGKEYEVFIYFHNDAYADLNNESEGSKGVAIGTTLAAKMPTYLKNNEAGLVKATIHADNANPGDVYDGAYLHAKDSVYLRFVPNSAIIHSLGSVNGTVLNSSALFGDGVPLGYDKNYWGAVPGCNEYAGYVTYRVKAEQPNFTISKEITADGQEDYKKQLTVKPGDTVKFKIKYKNIGTSAQNNVTAHDVLPSGVTYVPGSTFATTTADPTGKAMPDGYLFGEGLNLGNFQPGEEATLTYLAKVEDDTNIFACGDTNISNEVYIATAIGTQYAKVTITVNRECTTPQPEQEKNCKTNPEMPGCQTLPNTGPLEIILALLIVGGIAGGGYYFYRTKKALRTVKNSASGKSV